MAFPAATANEHVREGASQVAAPAGGTGVAAGCYDTAGNRNTFINLINAMRSELVRRGMMVGAATGSGFGATANEHEPEGAAQVVAPPGGTGAIAGGWDTAGNRDIGINLINELRRILILHGWMIGAASGAAGASIGNEHVREGGSQVVAPAGGTGAAAGGWDTAANRDTAINLVNEMRTIISQKGIFKGAA